MGASLAGSDVGLSRPRAPRTFIQKMNTSRKDMLIGLVSDYIGKLDEVDLYKILDLLRNTEEARMKSPRENVPVKKTPFEELNRMLNDVESAAINVPLYSNNALKLGSVDYDVVASTLGKLPEVANVINEITRLGISTAHYGIMVVPTDNNGDRRIDILFGVKGKFDAVATIDWKKYKIIVTHKMVGTPGIISSYHSLGSNMYTGLHKLGEINKRPTKQ